MTCGPVSKNNEEVDEYCRSIVREVSTLEDLLANDQMFCGDLEDDLRELWVELAEEAGEDPARYTPSALDYINFKCLEFILLGERKGNSDEWNVIGARLLRTSGGPYATIYWFRGDCFGVGVSWGSESSSATVHAPNLSAALAEMANALT